MQEGARLFWEGIRREMGPALESLRDQAEEMEPALRDFVEQMGPALRDLMEKAGDLSAYHAPEVLPNGDIILRRKTPQEDQEPRARAGGRDRDLTHVRRRVHARQRTTPRRRAPWPAP